MCRQQVGRVVSKPLEVFYAVITAHIPTDVVRVLHHYLGNGGSPATTTDNCYFSATEHFCFYTLFNIYVYM